MKKIFLLLLTVLTFTVAKSQYNPSTHTVIPKPLGFSTGVPVDARSYYYDGGTFSYRPYASTSEVLSYLNTTTKRSGHFPIYINTGGGVVLAYWFKDGTADGNLVPFVPDVSSFVTVTKMTDSLNKIRDSLTSHRTDINLRLTTSQGNALYTPIAFKTTFDALNGYVKVNGAGTASASTSIPQSDVNNLVSDLAGKAASSHTHTLSQITDYSAPTGAETKVQQGTNITVTGTGTTLDPYIINGSAGGSGSTEQADGVTILGDGSSGDKFRLDTVNISATKYDLTNFSYLDGDSSSTFEPLFGELNDSVAIVKSIKLSASSNKVQIGTPVATSGTLTLPIDINVANVTGIPIANVTDLTDSLNVFRDSIHVLRDSIAALRADITSGGGGGLNGINNTGEYDREIWGMQRLGSSLKGQPIGQNLPESNTTATMSDGQIRYMAVTVTKSQTLTGAMVFMTTAGNYTGDNFNGVALYSYSAGTLTKVAESTNSATLWTASANTILKIPFASTYSASPGIYYVAFLYNNSAQTTAPAIAAKSGANNSNQMSLDFTNSAYLTMIQGSQASLPASVAASSLTANSSRAWIGVY